MQLSPANFERFAEQAAYCVQQWPSNKKRDNEVWLANWAADFRKIYDDFAHMCERDPMLRYKPAHSVSEAFHRSRAPRRYFRAGNRCSKTQTALAEHYYVATAQHPHRIIDPHDRNSTVILAGLPFNVYAPNVFEKKFFEKEENNPIAPIFPEDGKWFCHYDGKNRIITIACVDCANAGKPKQCPSYHNRQTISLMNTENGIGVLEAFVARMGHIDEHVEERFFQALKQRLASAKGSFFIQTGTPLHGDESWETLLLANVANGYGDIPNLADPSNPKSGPLVELFEIDQFGAGIVEHDVIRREMADMDEAEIQARVYGRPTPLAENPVFDRKKIYSWKEKTEKPILASIGASKPIIEVTAPEHVFTSVITNPGPLQTAHRIFELPEKGAQYIMGIDVAAGLAPSRKGKRADASVCSVLKLTIDKSTLIIRAKLVAQFWGYINPLDYAVEIFKLGTMYNNALAIIELTGGLGRSVMIRLKDELAYPAIYRAPTVSEQAQITIEPRFGVETSSSSKPTMVAALQRYIQNDYIDIRCKDTLHELSYFEQVRQGATGVELISPKYKGANGAKDDRVMSLAIAIGTLVANPLIFDFGLDGDTIQQEQSSDTEHASVMQSIQDDGERDISDMLYGEQD